MRSKEILRPEEGHRASDNERPSMPLFVAHFERPAWNKA
jgi:hypothetical protein